MMVREKKAPPARRARGEQPREPARSHTFPAPVRGWVLNENLAIVQPGSALILDNWIPTTTGIKVRGGTSKYATLDAEVESLFGFKSGASEKLFGTTETFIYDLSTIADADTTPDPAVSGQTSGYYSSEQFGTAGGDFLYMVNGTDAPRLYDGTNLYPVNDAAIYGLAYDAETGTFTVGETVTGGTSSATATIVEIDDEGTTGTLYIQSITGTFQDNETITDGDTGSATSNIPSGVTTYSTYTLTGVDSSTLSHVWSFANRLFFVEDGTMSAWYLSVDTVAGALSEFSLAGVFKKGGSLLFGGTWSLDSGDGLDDKCVFVSTEGEVAVYEGTNPGDINDWSKVGVYEITKPLGKNATMQAGGDLLIATHAGLVPISQAIRKDPAALSMGAVSRQIRPYWTAALSTYNLPWELQKWPERDILVLSMANTAADDMPLVCNLNTGAWARFTGVGARCLGYYSGFVYAGGNDGIVRVLETGGSDIGTPYTTVLLGNHEGMGAPGAQKTVRQARALFKTGYDINPLVSAQVDYSEDTSPAPNSVANYTTGFWDEADWDDAVWDGGEGVSSVTSDWVAVGKTGYAIAPELQLTFGVTPLPRVELVSIEVTFDAGALVA